MAHTILTNIAKRRYEVTYTGVVSIQERNEATAKLFVKAATSGIRRVLVDFSGVDTSTSGFDPSPRLGSFLSANVLGNEARIAYVTTTPMPIDAAVIQVAESRGVPWEGFTDRATAIVWLEQDLPAD